MALWEGKLSNTNLYNQEKVDYIEADKIAKNCFMVWKNPFSAELPVWPETMLAKLEELKR
jgi:hypothetical protein